MASVLFEKVKERAKGEELRSLLRGTFKAQGATYQGTVTANGNEVAINGQTYKLPGKYKPGVKVKTENNGSSSDANMTSEEDLRRGTGDGGRWIFRPDGTYYYQPYY